MKHITILILFMFLGGTTNALAPTQLYVYDNVPSKIQLSTVYMNGAEITRVAKVELQKGDNKLIFRGLSAKIYEESIQVAVSGKATILSVHSKINVADEALYENDIMAYEDTIKALNNDIARLKANQDVFEKEKDLLVRNSDIQTKKKNESWASELSRTANFYRSRMQEINTNLYISGKSIRQINDQIDQLNEKLAALQTKAAQSSSQIIVMVQTKKVTTCKFGLRYMVDSATWRPLYNMRSPKMNKPVEFEFKAQIVNTTGVDWENVNIRLSTADPLTSSDIPQLTEWNIDVKRSPKSFEPKASEANYFRTYSDATADNKMGINDSVMQGNFFQEIEVTELNTEHPIADAHIIFSDGEPYMVDVDTYTLPANYEHFCVPKLDEGVYIIAKVTGWESFSLVEGQANVYYGDTYVGQTLINNQSIQDTLRLSLGKDSKVLVTRTFLNDQHLAKKSRSTVRETRGYQIAIKNNRGNPIKIEIHDQVPTSNNKEVKIKLEETADATISDKGELIWRHWVRAKQEKKSEVIFSIKYPKNFNVDMNTTRTIVAEPAPKMQQSKTPIYSVDD